MGDCIDLTSDGEGGAGPAGGCQEPVITLISSGDETPEKPRQEKRKTRPLKKVYREKDSRETDLDCCTPNEKEGDALLAAALKTPQTVGAALPEGDASEFTPQPARRKGRGRLTVEEKAAREAEKERKKQQRAEAREAKKSEKEAEKAARQVEREQQKLERQRETGKTALEDITVHLDSDLAVHRTGRAVIQRLEETFGAPGAGGPRVDVSRRLPMSPFRSATWSRAVYTTSASGTERSQPAERQDIKYTMLFFTAEEFVERVAADRLHSVIQQASERCPDATLGLMVEGLEHYLTWRERREFKANGPGGGGFKRADVDEFLGGVLCRWQGVRPLAVRDSPQAAEHIAGLTRALAEQPFRVEAAYVNSFGAGKPDSSAMNELLKKAPLPHKDREVWFKALACIPDLGPQIAYKVSEAHSSLGSLVATYHATAGTTAEKEGMLQNLVRFGGQRVGPAGSKKIFQILMSDDPNLCVQNVRKS